LTTSSDLSQPRRAEPTARLYDDHVDDAEVDLRTVEGLGLALGGGGVLGAAHVGVLQVLYERGIRPTIVAGTSAGALVGAAYAAGMDPYELETIALRANWSTVGKFTRFPGPGILDTSGLRRTVESLGGDRLIEDLPVRFGALATDVRTGASTLLNHGSVTDALCASIAIPGIFRPTKVGGRLLVDGGLVANLPIEAALRLGARHVVAVRLVPEWDGLPKIRNSTMVHMLEIRTDVTLIQPKLGGMSKFIPRRLHLLIEAGRHAAERVLHEYPVVRERPSK
jgi:NTE family protein